MEHLQIALIVIVIGALVIWLALRRRTPRRRFDFRIVGRFASRSQRQFLWDSLSAREMQVARLAVLGKRNADIARELDIKINTVETHLKNIYRKLDVHSRVELAIAIRDLVE